MKKIFLLATAVFILSLGSSFAQTAGASKATKDSLHADSLKKGLIKNVAAKPDPKAVTSNQTLKTGTVVTTTTTTSTEGGCPVPGNDTKTSGAVNGTQSKAAATLAKCQAAEWGMLSGIGWAIIILIVIAFCWIAQASELLKAQVMDPVEFMNLARLMPKYANETDINQVKKPYSLSRSQLGLWTVVIGCSYIYVELCKYFPVPAIKLDGTLLGLMGISAGTAAAGNLIDNSATRDQQGAMGPSQGFLKDILSDQNGINIHRFQNVIWTIIAVILYLCQIPDVPCGQLPTLDSTLIALTGISSATYLGLKINENKPPALPPPNANAANPQPVVAPGGAGGPANAVISPATASSSSTNEQPPAASV